MQLDASGAPLSMTVCRGRGDSEKPRTTNAKSPRPFQVQGFVSEEEKCDIKN